MSVDLKLFMLIETNTMTVKTEEILKFQLLFLPIMQMNAENISRIIFKDPLYIMYI